VISRSPKKRECQRAFRMENAKEAIGTLEHGCEVFGFTKGQFCLIHILEHCLQQTGPAEVDIATWSAASGDIQAANRMMKLKAIRRLRFLVDFSFPRRKPRFCQELIDTFGMDCLRVTKIHAKFITIAAQNWSLVIRTSMNLNYNPRFENFEISDDPQMLHFMRTIVDEIWETQEDGEGFSVRPADNMRTFERSFTKDGLQVVIRQAWRKRSYERAKTGC